MKSFNIPQPKNVSIHLKMTEKLEHSINRLAERHGTTRQVIINKILEDYFK